MGIIVTKVSPAGPTYTAATISFSGDTISDSASGFGVFSPGDYIKVTGSTNNDTTYLISAATASTLTLSGIIAGVNGLTTEAAGASVTITEGVGFELMDDFTKLRNGGNPIVLTDATPFDLRSVHKSVDIAADSLLGAAIDAGDVTLDVDGKSIPDSATLETIGSGFSGTETLAETLVAGNTSGGTAIQMSGSDKVEFGGTSKFIHEDGGGLLRMESNKQALVVGGDTSVEMGGEEILKTFLANPAYQMQLRNTTTDSTIKFSYPGSSGILDFGSVTGGTKTWTLPDATGTIALLSDIQASDEWSEVLANGNTSGGTNAQMSGTDQLQFGGTLNYFANGATGLLEGTSNKGFVLTGPNSKFTTGTTSTEIEDVANPGYKFLFDPRMTAGGRMNYVEPTRQGVLEFNQITATQTWTLPDATGTIALTSDIVTEDLAATLVAGNTTGGTDINIQNGDDAVFGTPANNNTITEGSGNRLAFNSDAGFFFTTGNWAMLQTSANGNFNVGSTVDATQGIQLIPNAGYIEVKSTTPGGVTTLAFSNATASRNIDFPDASGTVALVSDTQKINVVSKVFADSPYTAAANDVVLYDATGGASTVNLPAAASNVNAQITVKKVDASVNSVTIDGNLAETIDGALTQVLNAQYESITVVSDGSNWFII